MCTAAAVAVVAAGLTVWALADGWGAVAMSAITLWMLAANVAFLGIPLGLWKRRAAKIREDAVEEAWRKSQAAQQEEAAGGNGMERASRGPRPCPAAWSVVTSSTTLSSRRIADSPGRGLHIAAVSINIMTLRARLIPACLQARPAGDTDRARRQVVGYN